MIYIKYHLKKWLMFWAFLLEGLVGVATFGVIQLDKISNKAMYYYRNAESPYIPKVRPTSVCMATAPASLLPK